VNVCAPLERLVASLDPGSLATQRWFGGKGREVAHVVLVDGLAAAGGVLAIVDVRFADGETDRYSIPAGERLWLDLLPRLAGGEEDGALGGCFSFRGELPWPPAARSERPVGADQSNTSAVLGEELIVKCYRRLWPGPHPEVELVTYLAGRVACVPHAWGWVAYEEPAGDEHAVALVQAYVPGVRDGWAWGRLLHDRLAEGAGADPEGWGCPLGQAAAALHVALATGLGARDAEPGDADRWLARAREGLAQALERTRGEAAGRLRAWAPAVERELAALAGAGAARVSRIHGDLHVGQVLQGPGGVLVIDFEGEPTRPAGERRTLELPLRDVASVLRSLEHAPRWFLRERPEALPRALAWARRQRAELLSAYEVGVAGSPVGVDPVALRALEVEKATYELLYAASFLPEWTPVALDAMEALLVDGR
jgi:maltokinase